MQVTSMLSQKEHDHKHAHGESCSNCGHDHEHTVVPLWQTIIGLVFIINSFFIEWFFRDASAAAQVAKRPENMVAGFSAMLGAIILGYPIVVTAVKDLIRGVLTTNELVALAVLALVAPCGPVVV